MPTPMEMVKIKEIMQHVAYLFDYYGEDDNFFDEYMDSVLKHNLEKTLACFRELRSQLEKFPRIKELKNEQKKSGWQYNPPFA